MEQLMDCGRTDAAGIAGRVLRAFRSGEPATCDEALAHAERFLAHSRGCNEGEAERFEVLSSALDALAADRPESVRAGMYLLEHLASQRTRFRVRFQIA